MNSSTTASEQLKVWDLPLRVFHWTLVAVVAFAFLSSEEDSALAAWHQAAGWTAAVLIAFRLAWGFVGGQFARFASFLHLSDLGRHLRQLARGRVPASLGHNPLGALAIIGLLILLAATVVSGAQIRGGGGEDEIHEVVAYALLALVGVHVAAVILMSLLTRENLVRAFVTGRKRLALHPGCADAKPPAAFALPLAALVIVLAAYAITRLDPRAFAPQPLEGDEASSTAGAQDRHGDED